MSQFWNTRNQNIAELWDFEKKSIIIHIKSPDAIQDDQKYRIFTIFLRIEEKKIEELRNKHNNF